MLNNWTRLSLAKTIDQTLLKPTATEEDIKELCSEAKSGYFASVCVNPCWVPVAVKELGGSGISTCTVIGFPLGANASQIKAEETRLAVKQGAAELDMVINLGLLKTGNMRAFTDDIAAVVKAAGKVPVNVIIETCYLSNEEKRIACEAALKAGARNVKTSTGFGPRGATVEDIRFIRSTVGETMKVKASGDIRSSRDVITFLDAGADRVDTASGISIVADMLV